MRLGRVLNMSPKEAIKLCKHSPQRCTQNQMTDLRQSIFAKIVNHFQMLISFAKSSIVAVRLSFKYGSGPYFLQLNKNLLQIVQSVWNKVVTYFRKTQYFNRNSQYFDRKSWISIEILGISNQKFLNTMFFIP